MIKQVFLKTEHISIYIFIQFARYIVGLLTACRPLKHSFRCNNGMCIPETLHCNGAEDCDDGSDETIGCSKSYRSNVCFLFDCHSFPI